MTDLTSSEPGFVAAFAVTDAGKAEDFLKKNGKKDGDYYRDDDTYAVTEGDYLLLSQSKRDLAAGVKAQKGDALGDSKVYDDAIDELPDERLGAAFVDLQGLGKLADQAPDLDPAGKAVLKQFLGDDLKPVTAALTARADSATIETRFSGPGLARLASFGLFGTGASSELVKDAPGRRVRRVRRRPASATR